MSLGAAIVGPSLFVGAGTALSSGPGGYPVPPQNDGQWGLTLVAG
jgi:hypothetical protein